MCRFVLLALLICTVATAETVSDYRPRFNKAAYKNTLWTQANPWFPPNMSRIYRAGGPDYAMKRYPADNVQMWKEVALLCKAYGLDGIQQEVIICDAPDITTLREILFPALRLILQSFAIICRMNWHPILMYIAWMAIRL